ncbi:hypothetical protein SLEP1_g27559 [Rubroshorea leprosula]|uniref:Secreted protein n=1 Tax=Rubroshorea leprosula TaxID=152421 RepID=A0AAV5JQX3_9ROSI|nr:hypothetical protein SLEP1_g27559 [Rubroshorea leprosula]
MVGGPLVVTRAWWCGAWWATTTRITFQDHLLMVQVWQEGLAFVSGITPCCIGGHECGWHPSFMETTPPFSRYHIHRYSGVWLSEIYPFATWWISGGALLIPYSSCSSHG